MWTLGLHKHSYLKLHFILTALEMTKTPYFSIPSIMNKKWWRMWKAVIKSLSVLIMQNIRSNVITKDRKSQDGVDSESVDCTLYCSLNKAIVFILVYILHCVKDRHPLMESIAVVKSNALQQFSDFFSELMWCEPGAPVSSYTQCCFVYNY